MTAITQNSNYCDYNSTLSKIKYMYLVRYQTNSCQEINAIASTARARPALLIA